MCVSPQLLARRWREDGNRTSNKPALEQSRLSRARIASCLAHFQEETQNNRAKGEEEEEDE